MFFFLVLGFGYIIIDLYFIVFAILQEVRARTPTAFKLRNFAPNKRVRVTVNVGEFGQEREARFKTPSNKMDWKIAA